MPAHTAVNSVIVSAMRDSEVRQSDRSRKNSEEMNVPPEAMPIHQT